MSFFCFWIASDERSLCFCVMNPVGCAVVKETIILYGKVLVPLSIMEKILNQIFLQGYHELLLHMLVSMFLLLSECVHKMVLGMQGNAGNFSYVIGNGCREEQRLPRLKTGLYHTEDAFNVRGRKPMSSN